QAIPLRYIAHAVAGRLPGAVEGYSAPAGPSGGRGGIGRHAWFRSKCRKAWGFESLRPHQPIGANDHRRPPAALREDALNLTGAAVSGRPAGPSPKATHSIRDFHA